MLNDLKALFLSNYGLTATLTVLEHVVNIFDTLNNQLKDESLKDAAIDCIIQILQSEKTQTPKT